MLQYYIFDLLPGKNKREILPKARERNYDLVAAFVALADEDPDIALFGIDCAVDHAWDGQKG